MNEYYPGTVPVAPVLTEGQKALVDRVAQTVREQGRLIDAQFQDVLKPKVEPIQQTVEEQQLPE